MPANTPASWSDFFEFFLPQAALHEQTQSIGDEEYLSNIEAALTVTSRSPLAAIECVGPVVEQIFLERYPLSLLQHRLAPGMQLPVALIQDTISAVCVLSGRLRIRVFQMLNHGQDAGTVRLYLEKDCSLVCSETFGHTRTRNNIHEFAAGPSGASWVEARTYLRRDPQAQSFRLQLASYDGRSFTAGLEVNKGPSTTEPSCADPIQ